MTRPLDKKEEHYGGGASSPKARPVRLVSCRRYFATHVETANSVVADFWCIFRMWRCPFLFRHAA